MPMDWSVSLSNLKMTKYTAVLTYGLSLAITSFAQSTIAPSGKPSGAKASITKKSKQSKSKLTALSSKSIVVKVKPQSTKLLIALDTNKDGKLSFMEIEAAVKTLKQLDENMDGELTLEEFGLPEESGLSPSSPRKARVVESKGVIKAGNNPSSRTVLPGANKRIRLGSTKRRGVLSRRSITKKYPVNQSTNSAAATSYPAKQNRIIRKSSATKRKKPITRRSATARKPAKIKPNLDDSPQRPAAAILGVDEQIKGTDR